MVASGVGSVLISLCLICVCSGLSVRIRGENSVHIVASVHCLRAATANKDTGQTAHWCLLDWLYADHINNGGFEPWMNSCNNIIYIALGCSM